MRLLRPCTQPITTAWTDMAHVIDKPRSACFSEDETRCTKCLELFRFFLADVHSSKVTSNPKRTRFWVNCPNCGHGNGTESYRYV